jgi:hypothetical protein
MDVSARARGVFPNHLFAKGDLLGRGPGIVVKNVSVGKQMDVMMASMSLLRARGIEPPEDIPIGLANGDDVLAIGSAD